MRARIALAAAAAVTLVAAPAAAEAAVAPGADRVVALPTLGPLAQPQFAGYASADATDCADLACSDRAGLFYWLAARDDTPGDDPTILWSNGGPGASSMYGFLSENGPFTVSPAGDLQPYPHSWTSAANYLAFDHPLGVGMSFPFQGEIASGLKPGVRQLAHAVAHVVRRDGLQQSPLFLTGESYGGTYMPLLAERLLADHPDVRVGGVVIVDGWVAPEVQVGTTAEYAVTHGLIDDATKRDLDRVYARCRGLLRRQGVRSLRAQKVCFSIQDRIAEISGRWLGNIAQPGDIDYAPIEAYLNRPDVRAALHAPAEGAFTLGSDAIADRFARDVMTDYSGTVAALLRRGVPVMVVTGLNDAKDANFLGTRAWIDTMRWPGARRYARAASAQWKDADGVLGYRRRGGGLTTLEVLDAGHLAPRDQPKIIDALSSFMAAAGRPAAAGRARLAPPPPDTSDEDVAKPLKVVQYDAPKRFWCMTSYPRQAQVTVGWSVPSATKVRVKLDGEVLRQGMRKRPPFHVLAGPPAGIGTTVVFGCRSGRRHTLHVRWTDEHGRHAARTLRIRRAGGDR